jgi:hypothetical protein
MTKYWFKNDTTTVIAIGHNFVTRNERERHPVIEVCRGMTFN